MHLLREALESKIHDLLEHESISSWELLCSESSCVINTDMLRIIFYLDRRNNQITSSIEYKSIPEQFIEILDSETLSGLFPEMSWDNGLQYADIKRRVNAEIENLKSLLKNLRESAVTPRDMFYYVTGYSAGYTYVSSL